MLYPIGIQSFEEIRRNGYVYVDKTERIYDLVTTGKYYFLSRPRRFGKSLLISTLEAYFRGKKDLFEGLAMAELEKDWVEYPVLHLDLNTQKYDTVQALDSILNDVIGQWENVYGSSSLEVDLPLRFQGVIRRAKEKTGRNVVILVDEYDKPVLEAIGNQSLQDEYRKTLKSIYGALKSMDSCIKFALLTGVARFSKVSVFSDLNNLNDISLSQRFQDICGISGAELRNYFSESVASLAQANEISVEDCYGQLALMYDGYHFCENGIGIYNPFSLLKAFYSNKFMEYWFETGTPSFLVEVMRATDFDVTGLSEEQADATMLGDIEYAKDNPVPLLYQSGYLTIKGYDRESGIYTLGFPNLEVKHGFLTYLLNYYTTVSNGSGNLLIRQMGTDLRNGRPCDFMKRLESFFSRQNYQIQADVEKDFQYAMSIIIQLLGEYFNVTTEAANSSGRADITIESEDYVYIIEIKKDDSADTALAQIEQKGYARPYASGRRRVFKIGVSFSTVSRCIEEWKVIS
ncbi:MAG: AAA family ATPase [Candidatus Cryptobacteroides sp.]